MKRIIKPEDSYEVKLEETNIPDPQPGEIRIKAACSLISRGSELGFNAQNPTEQVTPGYSMAGTVDALGTGVNHLEIGDPVVALAPHAQYGVQSALVSDPREQTWVMPMPPNLSFDSAPYYPLTAGAVSWVEIENIAPQNTVVILGQGLVGSLILQVIKANGAGNVIAIDVLENRCTLAGELGADTVINGLLQDPVKVVKHLTNGIGADIVVYAVGGAAGPVAFEQGLDMLAVDGLIHLIGLNEDQPLSLSSRKIQRRKLLGGYYQTNVGATQSRRAMELLVSGKIQTARMTSHCFPWYQAADAFSLLDQKPGEALGVLLDWQK